LEDLSELYPEQLAVAYQFFPQTRVFPYAKVMATTAECGARQGILPAVHNELFLRQASIGERPWEAFTEELPGMDVDALVACVEAGDAAETVERQRHAAIANGIRGTPAIVVGDRLYYGMEGLEAAAASLASNGARSNLGHSSAHRWW
jgi:2-hydroxychromene-2-carboxylate isomerase